MTFKSPTILVASAVLSLAFAPSAMAFTHHPATPEEMRQTDALNAQALANARGASGSQQVAAMAPASASTMAAVAPLKSLAAMPPALSTASVQSSAGATVGNVQKILTGADGKPSMVNVALSSNQKIVAISADELNYDAAKNILVSTLTTEQIMSLPAASS
ncbi:MAG TPA: hypothetical protein VGJ08_16830 [Rhizomicrobium sp.]|jgi:hypothetical protein